MKEIRFKKKLKRNKYGYFIAIPPSISEALDCEEVYIIVGEGGIRIEPVPLGEPEIAYTDYKVKP